MKQGMLNLRHGPPYTIDELDERARQRVLDKNRGINVNYADWYSAVYEDAIEVGRRMGIRVERIYFSGFSSQGDGACFEGYYEYVKYARHAVKEYAPRDKRLRVIIGDITAAQRQFGYKLGARIKHQGHYYHDGCTEITVTDGEGTELCDDGRPLRDALRAFMRWIYQQLENEYDYQTQDEQVAAALDGNEFDEDGDLYEAS